MLGAARQSKWKINLGRGTSILGPKVEETNCKGRKGKLKKRSAAESYRSTKGKHSAIPGLQNCLNLFGLGLWVWCC